MHMPLVNAQGVPLRTYAGSAVERELDEIIVAKDSLEVDIPSGLLCSPCCASRRDPNLARVDTGRMYKPAKT